MKTNRAAAYTPGPGSRSIRMGRDFQPSTGVSFFTQHHRLLAYLLGRTWLKCVCVHKAVLFCSAGRKKINLEKKKQTKNTTSQMAIYSLPDFQAAFSTKLRAEEERKLLKPDLNTHLLHSDAWPQVPAGKGPLLVTETSCECTYPIPEITSLGP